jgi:hypothetical protein
MVLVILEKEIHSRERRTLFSESETAKLFSRRRILGGSARCH